MKVNDTIEKLKKFLKSYQRKYRQECRHAFLIEVHEKFTWTDAWADECVKEPNLTALSLYVAAMRDEYTEYLCYSTSLDLYSFYLFSIYIGISFIWQFLKKI